MPTDTIISDATIKRLENWKSGHKARSVTIDIDDSYGSTCWVVELRMEGGHMIQCFESGGLPLHGADRLCLYSDAPECQYETWPGLAATINAAIDRAEGTI